MTFIDAIEADELKNKVTDDLSQLGRLYRSKKNAYQVKSVEHNLVETMLRKGWEEFGKPLKTKTKLRKPKNHSNKFEDDIWCQLYELGFRCLNYSNDFILPFGKSSHEKKQIDVIAVKKDIILLVECKSSEKHAKAPSFKTEFEGLRVRLSGFSKALEQLFGKGKKIKYIFATRNLKLDRTSVDIKRLNKTGSFFYNDNTYEYVKGLIKSYKDAAHYQFLALLFKGQRISKDRIEVPAIEGNMGQKTYYMFSIEPHLLLKMGFILHRTRANEVEMPTYQRLLVPSRLKGITKFIQNGGYFPNSVILNFSTKNHRLQFEPSSRGKSTRSRSGTLKIPNAYAIAYIIDGQHRVYGYAQSDYKKSNTIPVVAFKDLDSTEQLEIFMDINQNQKAVSATLRITLEEDLYWNSNRTDSRMKALRSSIIRELEGAFSGPLYKKISIGEDKATLSAKPFATALIRSGLLPSAKGNNFITGSADSSLYNIHNHDHSSEMIRARDSIVKFLNMCYQYVEDNFSDIFERDRYFIVSNRGTYAFICLIGSLNAFESDNRNVGTKTSPSKRFNAIEKYLNALLVQINSLPEEDEKLILGKLGSGSEVAWLRFFQNLVNQKYSKYEPLELIDWKERQDQQLQDKGRKLGTDIEKYLKKTVINILKQLFGENWDIEIGAIQRECEKRAAEEKEKLYKEGLGRQEIPWTDQFFVTDYKKIIEKYWTRKPDPTPSDFKSFDEIFSIDAGFGFNSKAEKIKWLSVFNSHRNNWAHAGTKEKGLNRDEVSFLQTEPVN
ncbi:MAG TPA: DGQHR domain-containing protein [Chromatiales bacterium]|nr:DGQHR domain-containing protein [Thiotrichales bacterium]HIP69065.1 DGQHR domain-containing protein [Chromatiales bacterium]